LIEAIQDYEQAIKLNPKHANAFHGRGIAYAGLKQFKKAIWDYDQATTPRLLKALACFGFNLMA
jgi:regulator of sirC expression with transglutaminase-like and TPR domain